MSNQIQLVMYEGYLAADPEMRYTPSGSAVTNFRMGSNHSYKNAAGETVKETTWLKIVAWGKLGEIVNQWCKKGSHVIVTGSLRADKDGNPAVFQRKDGTSAASFEITAREVHFLDSKSDATGEATESSHSAPAVDEDDIPF